MKLNFELNGEQKNITIKPERRVADLLHDDFGLLSVKTSCNSGLCGSCTVLINNKAQLSCLIPCFSIQGDRIITYESFSETKEFREIRQAFIEHRYTPCSFCFPGKVLAVFALLLNNVDPDEDEILEALWGNRCSCDTYQPLIASVRSIAARRRMRKRVR